MKPIQLISPVDGRVYAERMPLSPEAADAVVARLDASQEGRTGTKERIKDRPHVLWNVAEAELHDLHGLHRGMHVLPLRKPPIARVVAAGVALLAALVLLPEPGPDLRAAAR